MRPGETKSERFQRLAEARVNKIIAMMRLLGNLCILSVPLIRYSANPVALSHIGGTVVKRSI